MSSTTPTELSASMVIARIQAGAYSREVIATMARGFLPLPQEDLIAVLAYLAGTSDAEISPLARESLKDVPARSVLAFASNESSVPEHLALLVLASEDQNVLESLIRNRSVPDDSIVELATRADAHIQEVIVINQLRILRAPQILDALLANPNLTNDARRRALETREEFFEKKRRLEELAEDELAEDLPVEPIADLLEKAVQEDQANAAAGVKPVTLSETDLEPDKRPVLAKILNMSVAQKVQLAFKAGKSERMILVRDRNKLVCSAAMRNPRMTETEAESVAGMRNVDDEVLRLVSVRRDWMSKYNVLIALARNPKCPIGVVVPLINRLTLRDLKALKDDKGVSDVVRQMSRKLFDQRSKKS